MVTYSCKDGNVVIKGSLGKYKLKKPIVFTLDNSDGVVCLDNDELDIHGCGNTIEEAIDAIRIVFECAIEVFVLCPEHELSGGAKQLRYKLLEYTFIN